MKYSRNILSVLVLCTVSLSSSAFSAGTEPLEDVLKKIQEEYDVVISYNTKDVADISVQFTIENDEDFESAINRALAPTNLQYKYLGLNFYILFKPNGLNKRKLDRINEKIEQIKEIGDSEEFIISEDKQYFRVPKKPIKEIFGQVTDEEGIPLIGASVIAKNTNLGTLTDLEGMFDIELPKGTDEIIVSYTGYDTQAILLDAQKVINVKLEEGLTLGAVTVFGSRGAPRTSFDSPVPVDLFSLGDLQATSVGTLDEQLSMLIPSFNSGQHPVSDASAHFNPIDLRGLLPSRTLVLVNGKRKNSSALLYTYVTASRGEVGVDMKSISSESIERVEVLRDGAAAQYGSDAVAGVINLVLKDKIKPFINTSYSSTGRGDGLRWKTSAGYSFDILKKGFVTVIADYFNQSKSQRAGTIHSAEDEAGYWGNEIFNEDDFSNYLNRNPSAGFQVGLPEVASFNLSLNSEYILNEEGTKLYAFGTFMGRSGSSPQFARGPYWVEGYESIYPDQDYFLPEMAPIIQDHSMSIGLQHEYKQWQFDISSNYGRSNIDYYINNSFNQSLGANSPKDFYNGTHTFGHWVNNIDSRRTFDLSGSKSLTLAFGLEQRIEFFRGEAGEFASYGDGSPTVLDRVGSESFSGLSPNDAVSGKRNNIGFYFEANTNVSDKMNLGGAVRFENYSDFGENVSWKFNTLYKIIDQKLNIRGSISNGFRAPSLHQVYYTSTTTTLSTSGIVQNRILNNLDPSLAVLDIPRLMPERSLNFAGGLAYRLNKKIGVSVDLYQIDVNDRIVLSGQVGNTENGNTKIDQLLEITNTGSAGFFLNAVDSRSSGIDIVFNFDNISIGKGRIKANIAANINKTSVKKVNLPESVSSEELASKIFSREDISRLESWRPRQKMTSSISYTINNLSNTIALNYIGGVEYRHATDVQNDAKYGGKFLMNWNSSYQFNNHLQLAVGVQNLFNVYPDTFLEAYGGTPTDQNIDFVGRFKYPWQTMQFGTDGIRFFTKVTYTI
ncbi:MAG: iron complex outermembrane receptor protein [Halioglobus sp.]|jgi:iron complex outermembrane receptor protein